MQAAEPALIALRAFNDFLDGTLAKKTSDWRLGKVFYAKKFSYVLATGKTPDALLQEAEADLIKTRDEMVQLAAPKTVEAGAGRCGAGSMRPRTPTWRPRNRAWPARRPSSRPKTW